MSETRRHINGDHLHHLKPTLEVLGIDNRYSWSLPLKERRAPSTKLGSVWYIALPISSAHRGGHSGGGALIEGVGGQERYANEGTVYPHSALVEMITYQTLCFPDLEWRYIDLSHESIEDIDRELRDHPPDVVAMSVYTSTALWAYIVAAKVKKANPNAVVVFGNDHASLLRQEILGGAFGRRLVDFVGTGNNGPFTLMGILYMLQGQLDIERIPSIAYRKQGVIVDQEARSYPLNKRLLPDYRLIRAYLEQHYDKAFGVWYAEHYELKRMVTVSIDAGCHWGMEPRRRCKHCSIQGLTPKVAAMDQVIPTLEAVVGELGANVYSAGDSSFGFSSSQWGGNFTFLNELAEACAKSPVLKERRFMLAYGLVQEFIKSAELCKGFIRTWNVGIEAFDPRLLKNNSKGVNRGSETIYEAFEIARRFDYRIYASGILGLPGTTLASLRREVDQWLAIAETYQDLLTTVSVALPAVIPGSRMYWETYLGSADARACHGELVPCRKLSEDFIAKNTEVTMQDVEAAIRDVGRGVLHLAESGGNPTKFGGYMMGGTDDDERYEQDMLRDGLAHL